jgi:hypothetical protein
MLTRRSPAIALALALASSPLLGQDALSKLELHGYGTWGYGRTPNDNAYLYGRKGGDYSNVDFALNLTVRLGDRLRIHAQNSWTTGGDEVGTSADLDYAFAEWVVSDKLQFRLGAVKQPFGIYTEIFDVGTVRPFLALPQSIYGGTGFAGEAYKGVGLTGAFYSKRGWGLAYDAYVGGMNIEESAAPVDYLLEGASAVQGLEIETTRDAIGGRLILRTPIDGLSFGTSAYTGVLATDEAPRRTVVAGHAELVNDKWSLRGEFAHESSMELGGVPMRVNGGYVEAGYRFTSHVQGGLLYDRLQTTLVDFDAAGARRP